METLVSFLKHSSALELLVLLVVVLLAVILIPVGIWIVIASANPNSKQASIVCTGRHLPKMSAARAMKPRPAAMLRVNRDDWPIER